MLVFAALAPPLPPPPGWPKRFPKGEERAVERGQKKPALFPPSAGRTAEVSFALP